MAVALDQFVKQLEDSGIVADQTLKDFLPPKSEPKDAEELIGELVRQKKLTKFQADEVAKGNGKSLVLGNYVLMEKIGSGGMGQVFKAEHRRMHRIVAIKVLPPNMTKDAAAIARFEREVTAVAKISHPNIVAAYDADCADGVHFLVMELVEGNDLHASVKKNGPFPVEKAVNYVLQAAKGLEAAHRKGIVHRDIKPANLLLDTEGTVKILDMGLARIETAGVDAATQTELTGSGAVMGTVDYMSPEQAVDSKTADARADIYSLGCSLYYLLTGKPIYEGDSLMNRMLAHRDKPIPSLCAAQPGVPEQLEAIFKKMVAKNVENRYQNMTAVIADLERCSLGNEQTIVFHPPVVPANDSNMTNFVSGTASTPTKPIRTNTATTPMLDKRKNKLLLIGSAVVGVLMLVAGLAMTLKPVTEPLDVKPAVAGTKPVPVTRVKPPTVAGPKKPLFFQTPDFEPWAKEVAAMPAEKQVEAVSNKLMELNPGFNGKVTGYTGNGTPKIENGVVTQFGFDNDNGTRNVTDISPLRALGGLNSLWCGLASGQLADLSPLTGMQLEHLVCPYTRISDLSPLTGMKLKVLDCAATQVSDLSPLKGMPLGLLGVSDTPVSDISILQGMMSLKRLAIANTRITDLRPIQGLGLDLLVCDGVSVSDLSLLNGMPLKHLALDFKPERDTELVRSFKELETINRKPAAEFWKDVEEQQKRKQLGFQMPGFDQWMKSVPAMPAEQQVEAVVKKLQELNPGFDGNEDHTFTDGVVTDLRFSSDNIVDISPVRAFGMLSKLVCAGSAPNKGKLMSLSPLRGMPLRQLHVEFNDGVSDLSPLQGMKLVNVTFAVTRVADLSPLKGMPINWMSLHGARVTDVTPLEGMPLTGLFVSDTQVSDLSPLKRIKLTHLFFRNTQVSDLSPLEDMPLKELNCDFNPKRDTELLRSIKTLERINDKPLAEFWKEFEEQQKGKKLAFQMSGFEQWMKSVAAMPAEQQVEAVVKKLQELNPGFDGNEDHTLTDGVVTDLRFSSDNIVDISPVRALVGLSRLACESAKLPNGKLEDLLPLKGMQLVILTCHGNQIHDLSPLEGMKLLELNCGNNPITDLSPLQGMPLRSLNVGVSNVSNLSMLKEMPLKVLSFNGTKVTTLSPLEGMALTHLFFQDNTITDLSPLKGMPLEILNCGHTPVFDLSPLEGMPLTSLYCYDTPFADSSLLHGFKNLTTLNLKRTKVTASDVAALQKALPDCKIDWDDPAKAKAP